MAAEDNKREEKGSRSHGLFLLAKAVIHPFNCDARDDGTARVESFFYSKVAVSARSPPSEGIRIRVAIALVTLAFAACRSPFITSFD
jgi:hypothetical protein